MPRNVAIRDLVRRTFLGPLLRDYVIKPYRRRQRLREVRHLEAQDPARFVCNICGYKGMFASITTDEGPARQYAVCPQCGSYERHRMQLRVLEQVFPAGQAEHKSMLHFAPEEYFVGRFRKMFEVYKTADLFRADVDYKVNLTSLPMRDGSFDVVYASHVLEHITDDRKAVSEIYRVLKPGGIAILPVPIYNEGKTEEYGIARPEEHGHVRAPGLEDYFDRYRDQFEIVKVFSSADFDGSSQDNQVYVRALHPGGRVEVIQDHVPVCTKINA